jgi:hypothetical protein
MKACDLLMCRLGASAPKDAAAVAAAKLRQKQQECLAAAKAAAKLNSPLRLDYAATARGQVGGGAKQRSAHAARRDSAKEDSRRVYSSSTLKG